MRLNSGVHADVPMDRYIADPSETPSLNATAATLLIQRSPLHCWHASPRLNPDWRAENNSAADVGSVAHHVLLAGDTRDIAIIDADDWRTKAAKEQREEAYARGAIPILIGKMEIVHEMVNAARKQLAQSELAGILDDGHAELTLIAERNGCFMRSRPDWWTADRKIMLDLKTTQASAKAESWARIMFNSGYHLQAEIAMQVAKILVGAAPQFYFLVLEQDAPYGLSIIGVPPTTRALAAQQLDHACNVWKRCLSENRWPCYPGEVQWAEPPAWMTVGWLDDDPAAYIEPLTLEQKIEYGGQA